MRAFKLDGIVIKRRNVGEGDRILTVFSKNRGKIQIKAKGVRKITSRRSGHIELLNYCIFNLHQGKNMPILTEVEAREDFYNLKQDLKKIGLAYHVCELVDGLCAENLPAGRQDQETPEIFLLLGRTLRKISKGEGSKQVIKQFELSLLKLLGFYSRSEGIELNTHEFIENILERKLKSKQVVLQLYKRS